MKHVNRFIAKWRLGVILCLGSLIMSCTHVVREVSQKRFISMVKEHEVQQVKIVNGHLVEAWLKPYAAESIRYNNMFNNREPDEPHFQLRIESEKAFRQDIAKINPKLSITSEERHGLLEI